MTEQDRVGDAALRTQFFDTAIKQVTAKALKFMQGLTVTPTSAWKNTFYRERRGVLTAGSDTQGFEGIPRGANFPRASVEWEKITRNIVKYGAEDFIFWEDILSDDIDVRNRTVIKLSEAVANQIDSRIWTDLGGDNTVESQSIGAIQSFSVMARPWTSSSANIIDDLFRAKQLIGEANYPTDNLQVWMDERHHRAVMKYLTDKGAQYPQLSTRIAENGQLTNIAGFDIVVSNNAAASTALVVIPKRCATWKELVPMQSTNIEDKYKGETIRVVGEGVVELTDPFAVVAIMGTVGTEA